MSRKVPALLVGSVLAAALAAPGRAAEAPPADRGRIRSLIRDLESPVGTVYWGASVALTEMGAAAVLALLEVLESDDLKLRRRAVRALGGIGPAAKDAVPGLVKLLEDPNKHVRWDASWALSKMGAAPVPALIELLKGDKPKLRSRTLEILHRIGRDAKEAVPPLVDLLGDHDATLTARAWAARVLGRICAEDTATWSRRVFRGERDVPETGSRAAVPALVAAIRDEVAGVRGDAAKALAAIGPAAREAVPSLVDALDDPAKGVRSAAAMALQKIGADAETALPALVKALGDEDRSTRLYAAGALSMMGADAGDAVPALVRTLATTHIGNWIGAYNAVVNIGPAAIPALIEALRDESSQVRGYAIEQLGRFGSAAKEAMPALERLAGQGEGHERCAAVRALGATGAEVVPALIRLLDHADAEVRSSAAGALRGIGPEASSAVPTLAKALADKDWRVRESACQALGRIGTAARASAPALEKAFGDESPCVRVYAAEAHWRVTGETAKAVPVLLRTLEKSNVMAARALGEIGPPAAEAVPMLTTLLKHKGQTIREAAAEALGKVGPAAREAVPALREALEDEGRKWYRYGVRLRAAEALWRITGRTDETIPVLIAVTRSGDHTLWRALEAFKGMGPAARDAVPALVRILGDGKGYGLERQAGEALGRIGPAAKDAVPALEKALDCYSRDVRVASAEALWRITGKAEKSLPVLVRIARDKGWDQRRPSRRRAVEVIGTFGLAAKDTLPVLREFLTDEDPDIRKAAAEATGKIAGRRESQ